MDFSKLNLDERLMRAVGTLGFEETTPIQEKAIPVAIEGRDILGTAQTGTGKTAAFVLPILQRLLLTPRKRNRTRALIITPTRELAEQVNDAVRRLSQYTPIRSASIYGGVGFDEQRRALRKGTDVIVACPGRLLDHLGRNQADLGGVETLVLDEADRMLDMGFIPDVRRIVDQTPRHRQTMLFSATFPSELTRLASEILRSPERVEVGITAPPSTVDHWLYPVQQQQKTSLLLRLLEMEQYGSVLIFTRTKHRADRLTKQVKDKGYKAAVLHSDRSQGQRQRALDGFREGTYQLLVATDIAARGLDVDGISHVINFDMPASVDDYIHRIGRTGRAERSGSAMTLVTCDDRGTIRDIERCLGQPLPVRELDGYAEGVHIRAPRKLPQRTSAESRRRAAEQRQQVVSDRQEPESRARRLPRRKTVRAESPREAGERRSASTTSTEKNRTSRGRGRRSPQPQAKAS